MKMEVNKFLSYGKNIDTNFNNIRNNEEYQSLLENTKNKKIKYPKLKFVMYTLSIIVLTVFGTILTQKIMNTVKPVSCFDPGKTYSVVRDNHLDQIICFGPEGLFDFFTPEVILNSDILNENDENTLRQYLEEQAKLCSGEHQFTIYFGLKDGEEKILVGDLHSSNHDHHLSPPKIFYFDSNLDYSLESIVSDFEEMINIELTDEFLNSVNYNSLNLVSGIILDFVDNGDNTYSPYYKVIIDGKVYVLNK